jgi:hypothetical protein
MKIRAVRLADVGRFREPVAIEGFGGQVDVLAGPNELGKSTIFRAVEAGLLLKHNSTRLAGILPRTGGTPLIEIDIEVDEQRWRIQKRFGSTRVRMAELTNLSSGRLEARGADADTRLAELLGIGGSTGDRFGLLWIGQDSALLQRMPEDAERTLLGSLIESEIMEVAGGAELSQIRRRVGEILDQRTTPANRHRAKAHSDYAAALARRTELEGALANARAAEQSLAAGIDELEQWRGRLQDTATRARSGAMTAAVVEAEQKLSAAREAQLLHSSAQRAAGEDREAHTALEKFQSLLAELAELTTAVEADRVRLQALRLQIADAETATAQSRDREIQLRALEQAAHARLDARSAADAATVRTVQRTELEQRLAEVQAIAARMTTLEAELASARVTTERLAAIERETRAIDLISARVDAARPSLDVDYLPGRDGTVSIDGQPVAGGTAFKVDRPLLIEIAGIGTLRVTPGGSADIDADAADLAVHQQQLATLLQTSGVTSLVAARTAHARRQAIETEAAATGARLGALAPRGITKLMATIDALKHSQPEVSHTDLPTRAAIEFELAEVKRDLTNASAQLAKCIAALEQARHAERELAGAASVRAGRLAALGQQLPPAALLSEERARLARRAEDAAVDAAAATRSARLMCELAPSDSEIALLVQVRKQAEDARVSHASEMQTLERAIERREGEIEESIRLGGGRRVQELEGELERASAEVDAHEQELAALRLLAEELDAVERAQRTQFLTPVTRRLTPYLAEQFGSARIAFGDKLDSIGLERNGDLEALPTLSGGTREQVAVLVRLAFGRLLADSGAPAPVILDDALVYSDDARIARLFRVIELAATHHQVIILTCRSQTFASLGGTRLEIAPWKMS